MSEDEFDNMPDDFADIQGVDWAQILAGPSDLNHDSTQEQHSDLPGAIEADISILSIPARPASSHSSTDYFEDDYGSLDASFLAELDRIEEELAEPPQHSHLTVGGKAT